MAADASTILSAFVILQLVWNFGCVYALRLLELKVPSLADPRDNLTLGCRFDMGTEELNSVKWYKDDNEFFRYTPRSQPHVMSFPVAGVHLAGGDQQASECDTARCIVRLTRLSTAHSGGSYRCEVSTEAPTFHVAFDAANVTVAALGRHDPLVASVLPAYDLGDLVVANCTAAAADPAPHLAWLVNGRAAPGISVGPVRTTRPDALGLVTRSLVLRFHAEKRHFPEPRGLLELQCVTSVPGVFNAPTRNSTVTAHLRSQSRTVLSNQKLEWLNGSNATNYLVPDWIFIITALASLCWR